MPKTKRINARISGDLDALLQELAHARGLSVSDIVVSALKDFCNQQSARKPQSPYAQFKKAGLIGCFAGPGKLSQDYKQEYAQLLDQKWSRATSDKTSRE